MCLVRWSVCRVMCRLLVLFPQLDLYHVTATGRKNSYGNITAEVRTWSVESNKRKKNSQSLRLAMEKKNEFKCPQHLINRKKICVSLCDRNEFFLLLFGSVFIYTLFFSLGKLLIAFFNLFFTNFLAQILLHWGAIKLILWWMWCETN